MEKDHKKVKPFPPKPPFPPNPDCEDCFDTRPNGGPWPPGLLTQFEAYLFNDGQGVLFHETTIHDIAELCEVLIAASMTSTPVTVEEMETLLNDALPGMSNPRTIANVIAYLLEAGLLDEGVASPI
jgi:hypothetical protein